MAANPQRGEIEINIGGHPRVFRWRTSQIAMLEDRLGCGIAKILSEDRIGLKTLVEALFVGGVVNDKRLTPNKVAKWIDDYQGDLGDLMSQVFRGIATGLPGVDLDEEEEGQGADPLDSPLVSAMTREAQKPSQTGMGT